MEQLLRIKIWRWYSRWWWRIGYDNVRGWYLGLKHNINNIRYFFLLRSYGYSWRRSSFLRHNSLFVWLLLKSLQTASSISYSILFCEYNFKPSITLTYRKVCRLPIIFNITYKWYDSSNLSWFTYIFIWYNNK